MPQASSAGLMRCVMSLAIALGFAICGQARAEDVWRIAGTFNGWNATDPAWTMARRGGQWVLEKELPTGSHRFKYVRNGAWDQGHLGAGRGGELTQPGDDLLVRVPHSAEYRFTLDVEKKVSDVRAFRAREPVLDARVIGPVMAGREFILDMSDSISTDGRVDIGRFVTRLSDPEARNTRESGSKLRRLIVPSRPGPLSVEIGMTEGDQQREMKLDLNVLPNATVRYATVATPSRLIESKFEAQADGSLVALLRFDAPVEFSFMDVTGLDAGDYIRVENTRATAGTYAIIVRDGKVVTSDDKNAPLLLHRGDWRTVLYMPTQEVQSVHFIGEFNNWARPGQPGSLPLQSQTDGNYRATVNLPEGPHRYKFLIDGETEALDPVAKLTAAGSPGGLASVVVVGPRPAEYGEPKPNAIDMRAVRHSAESTRDFLPISAGLGLADIGISTLPHDVEKVVLNIEADIDSERKTLQIPLPKSTDLAGFDRWSTRVMVGKPQARYWFTLIDGSKVESTPNYERTIAPAFETPDWAKGAVWYQIFPERFRNGNPRNDPRGQFVYNKPWTDDWYTITPAEEASWRERYKTAPNEPWPPRKGGNLFHVVWDRRYGGDLQGIAEKFGYLRDLGITALYMNPVFEAESMHKYDATDYRHIDDNLATPASAGDVPESWTFDGAPADPKTWKWTPGDRYFVDEFLPAAKNHGIKVVLDGVFNHTGKPFFAFADIMEKGDKSPYKDWFYVSFDENGKLKNWESWFNTGALPKFRQMPNGDLVPPVKEHIFNITRRWMDPNGDGDPSDGIDGWRLDVALDVGLPFWRDWRKLVKGINPQAVIIAEIWDDATPVLQGDSFDTQMHYPFCKPVLDWLGVRPGTPTSAMVSRLDAAFDDAAQTNLIHQNLFCSHDTDRYVSMLLNPGREYDQGNRPQDHDYPYIDKKPSEAIYKTSLLGVAIQALYTGAPMVYYGDEVGMWGADDPTDRKPFPWPDKGTMKNPDENGDWDLHKQYAKWMRLRQDPVIGPILRLGATRHLDSGDENIFAFERSLNGHRVVAVINRRATAFDASPLLPKGTSDARVGAVDAKYWLIEAPR